MSKDDKYLIYFTRLKSLGLILLREKPTMCKKIKKINKKKSECKSVTLTKMIVISA